MLPVFLLLVLIAAQQPVPAAGTLSGRIRDSSGAPAAGVRVALAPAGEDVLGAAAPVTLTHISQTDGQGRYRLDSVQPGRYRIAAGAVTFPSFYPGVVALDQATIVTVAAGQTLAGLDFSLAPRSLAPAGTIPSNAAVFFSGKIVKDDGGSFPPGLTLLLDGNIARLHEPFRVSGNVARRGRLTVSRLPLGYFLKSITFNGIDLTRSSIPATASPNSGLIEIVLTKERPPDTPPGVTVSGRFINWREGSGLAVPLSTGAGPAAAIAFAEPAEDGSFVLQDVPPGRYRLATLTIQVADQDIGGLLFKTDRRRVTAAFDSNAFRTIHGTVSGVDGAIPQFEIHFVPTEEGAAPRSVKVSGRDFSTELPEGEYRAVVSGLPKGYMIESVTAGPLDATAPFQLIEAGIADPLTGKPIQPKANGDAGTAGARVSIRLKAEP